MFSQKLLDAMNEQMKNEFLSAYLYLAMCAFKRLRNSPTAKSFSISSVKQVDAPTCAPSMHRKMIMIHLWPVLSIR